MHQRDLQDRQQLVTPDVFQNGDESEDSEDHLDTTLEENPDRQESQKAQDPEAQGELN